MSRPIDPSATDTNTSSGTTTWPTQYGDRCVGCPECDKQPCPHCGHKECTNKKSPYIYPWNPNTPNTPYYPHTIYYNDGVYP